MAPKYPPVPGHTIIPSDRRDCRYACACGLPLGTTKAESVRLHRAHKVNLYAATAPSPSAEGHPGRYAARQHNLGERRFWGVYDTEKQSWPAMLNGKRVPHMEQEPDRCVEAAAQLNRGEW